MATILHRTGRRGAAEGGGAAELLAAVLGTPFEPRAAATAEWSLLAGGEGVAGAWGILVGADLVALPTAALRRCVVLPRLDPRWSLEDIVHRPLGALPPGTVVVTGSPLGAALLSRARPDLRPVRAGGFPLPEETPVLAEGPYESGAAGHPLDPPAFLPAPGTGIAALLPPAGGEAPEGVLALEDGDARTALRIERGFAAGVGELPPGAALGALAKRKVSVLFRLRAVLFPPRGEPRVLSADIPLADAVQFARTFGRHLAGG